MSDDGVLEYLEDAYAFLGDPAIGKAIAEIRRLRVYRDAVHRMCSARYEEVDDYIRVAKQAVADYEALS
jgi:hypothetical protein